MTKFVPKLKFAKIVRRTRSIIKYGHVPTKEPVAVIWEILLVDIIGP